MKILIGCEESAKVRDAFLSRGHDAYSCDLLPTRGTTDRHIVGDVFKAIELCSWDMLICFPPCTHVCVSGARWWRNKQAEHIRALEFMRSLFDTAKKRIKHVAMENPIGAFSTFYRKPDQIIQPWMFGHGETKATCLWLENLPKLIPTNIVGGRDNRIHRMAPGPRRQRNRSETYSGIADAMAEQWGHSL